MRRRFQGYYVIREYGHCMPTQYEPLFVASRRRAEALRDWYDGDARSRYSYAFYAYVIRAHELPAAKAQADNFARYPYDPRHTPIERRRA
jgi:hypothetical protein